MKLGQIPKPAVSRQTPPQPEETTPQLSEAIAPSISDDQEFPIYGVDKNSPEYPEMQRRLKHLKRTDPELFRKITGLD